MKFYIADAETNNFVTEYFNTIDDAIDFMLHKEEDPDLMGIYAAPTDSEIPRHGFILWDGRFNTDTELKELKNKILFVVQKDKQTWIAPEFKNGLVFAPWSRWVKPELYIDLYEAEIIEQQPGKFYLVGKDEYGRNKKIDVYERNKVWVTLEPSLHNIALQDLV